MGERFAEYAFAPDGPFAWDGPGGDGAGEDRYGPAS
jgi:hypothetical protein